MIEFRVPTGSSIPIALHELARSAPPRTGAAMERYEITLDLDRSTLSLELTTLEKRTVRASVQVEPVQAEGASAIPPETAPRPAPAPPARPRGLQDAAYAFRWLIDKVFHMETRQTSLD